MATIKLGAFIASIAGSVGGTTFRRYKNSIIVTNKSRGHVPDPVTNSNSLAFLSGVFSDWNVLSTTDKQNWNALAAANTFQDKFGDQHTISGRQLFVKLNSTAKHFEKTTSVPFLFDKVTTGVDITTFKIPNPIRMELTLKMQERSSLVLLQLVVLGTSPLSVGSSRLKVVEAFQADDSIMYFFDKSIFEDLPLFTAGAFVQIFVTPVNEFYYRGPSISAIAQVGV